MGRIEIIGCYVYVATRLGEAGGPVKVGISTKPGARIASLQTGNPERLAIGATFWLPARQFAADVEADFAIINDHARLVGEWYRLMAAEAVASLRPIIHYTIYRHAEGRPHDERIKFAREYASTLNLRVT